MDEDKNKIPKDKDGDDHLGHQKDGSPSNEELGLKNGEKKSSDQPTQGVDEGTSTGTGGGSMVRNPTVENRDLGNQTMPEIIEQLANIEVTYKGRFTVTRLRRNLMNPFVRRPDSADRIGNIRITQKGRFTITEYVRDETNQGAGSSVAGSGGSDHTRNIGSSVTGPLVQKGGLSGQCSVPPTSVNPMPRNGDAKNASDMDVESGNQGSGSVGAVGGEGDPNVSDQCVVFGPVTQKGGFSDQCSVPPPSANPMPRTGDQDNMERRANAKRNGQSSDDPHNGEIGEASHGEESEDDDMELNHDDEGSIPKDPKRAKK